MYYGQPLTDSVIAIRHQLYYLVFFLFLITLNTRENVNQFMRIMTILSLVLIGMAVINYLGFNLFHHKWAEGHGERAGITRAFIPGMEILVTVGVWHIVRYLEENQHSNHSSLALFLIVYAAVLFRQTRMYILSLSIIVVILLVNKRRFKTLAGLSVCSLIVGALFTVLNTSGENIVLSSFQSAYEDVKNEEGTWRSRMDLIRYNLEIIKEHPYLGNGGLQIRAAKESGSLELQDAAYGGDLGYIHVIKFLGIPGLIWMVSLIIVYYSNLVVILKNPNVDIVMAKFSGYLFTLILIAAITMNFFQDPTRLLFLCLAMAILVNAVETDSEQYV